MSSLPLWNPLTPWLVGLGFYEQMFFRRSITLPKPQRICTPFAAIELGQVATLERVVTEGDIQKFSEASGDTNPLHLDDDFARATLFKGRIAHGMLTASYISALFGTLSPGPGAIYISQTLKFTAPVRIGDTVVTRTIVTELLPEKKRVSYRCECSVKGGIVLHGEAVLQLTV